MEPSMPPLSVEAIRARVTEVGKHDSSYAHSLEDDLHRDVLEKIAAEAPEPWRSLAAEALKTRDLDFDRFYD